MRNTSDKNCAKSHFIPDQEDPLDREKRIIDLFHSLISEVKIKDQTHQKGITVEHVRRYLQKTHIDMSEQYSHELIAVADKSKDGIIDYEEFRRFVIHQETVLWKLFKQIDLSNDLRLQPEELADSLSKAGIKVEQGKLKSLVEKMDEDGDGSIDFNEWRNFLLDISLMSSDGEVGVMNSGSNLEIGSKLYYLVAGGIAGAVSRTVTAPLDRIKVFLQTRSRVPNNRNTTSKTTSLTTRIGSVRSIITTLYAEGGIPSFFRGNGINVVKIIPESATKFYAFEQAKAIIGNGSSLDIYDRLLAGGLAGLASQSLIYPLELVKTRRMTSLDRSKSVFTTGRDIFTQNGIRGFYKGLPTALVGIFPFAAIDLALFETLKKNFLPEDSSQVSMVSLLGCGMISGTVGAISVYPLSLVRTRLQAQGSSTHPKVYTGAWHVVRDTYKQESFHGFYRGLGPTLLKVVPALSISYVVYETSKRKLGIP